MKKKKQGKKKKRKERWKEGKEGENKEGRKKKEKIIFPTCITVDNQSCILQAWGLTRRLVSVILPPHPGQRELGYLSTSAQESLVESCSGDGHSFPSTSDLPHKQAERLRARESPQVLTAGSLAGKSERVHAQGIWAGAGLICCACSLSDLGKVTYLLLSQDSAALK